MLCWRSASPPSTPSPPSARPLAPMCSRSAHCPHTPVAVSWRTEHHRWFNRVSALCHGPTACKMFHVVQRDNHILHSTLGSSYAPCLAMSLQCRFQAPVKGIDIDIDLNAARACAVQKLFQPHTLLREVLKSDLSVCRWPAALAQTAALGPSS